MNLMAKDNGACNQGENDESNVGAVATVGIYSPCR